MAKAPINGVVSAINSVLGRINNISVTIPEWVPGVGEKTLGFNLPTIPMLASGGIVTAPTILEAGEGGEPEAILPLSRLAALLDGFSGKGWDSSEPLPENSGEARPDSSPLSGMPPADPDGIRPVPPSPPVRPGTEHHILSRAELLRQCRERGGKGSRPPELPGVQEVVPPAPGRGAAQELPEGMKKPPLRGAAWKLSGTLDRAG